MSNEANLTPARFATNFFPDFKFPPHVQGFQRASMRLLFDPRVNRQVVEAPVRHGKSVWHSIIVPAWHCLTFPDKRVLGVSYGASLSDTFSREVVKLVTKAAPSYGLEMDPKWTRVDSFRFADHQGGYDSVGAGGAVAGKGYHLIAADDLVKDEEEARSPTMRNSLERWFRSDLMTRCEPGAKVSLVMSRRHPSDLSGMCLAMNAELPESLKWDSVKFPAIDEEGNALWPERFPIEKLRDIEREYELSGTSYLFRSLYQQDPYADPAGCEFPSEYFGSHIFYDELPPDLQTRFHVISCDPSKGSKSKSGDYAAFVSARLTWTNELWCDVKLVRMTAADVIENLAAMIVEAKPHAASVEVQGFQELIAAEVRRRLDAKGCIVPLHPFDSSEQKETRVRLSMTEWLHTKRLRIRDTLGGRLCVAQLREFPSGEHDDGPDVLSQSVFMIGEALL